MMADLSIKENSPPENTIIVNWEIKNDFYERLHITTLTRLKFQLSQGSWKIMYD